MAPRGLRALLAAALLLLLATGAVHVVREALRDKTPNQTHARRLGLEEYLYLVAPLDADQEQDPLEKQLVELLARSKQALEIPVVREAVLNATRDGRVTPEELTHLEALLARAGALAAEYPELARSTGSNHTLFHTALSLHESQPQLLKELYRSIVAAKHKEALLARAIALLQELGYTRSVKVLNPSTGSFEEKNPSPLLAQVVANYTLALAEGLPRHSNQDIWLLGNATMINPEIYDFKPATVKDMNGTVHQIGSKNIPRDTWALVEHLKYDPEIVKYPETYLALSIKVQQNMYDLVDNPVLHERGEYYKPTDKIIWERVIIPQWRYYRDSFPQFGNVSKRTIVFPIYDSNLLRKLIPNEDDLKIALMFFWNIYIDRRGIADIDEDLKGKDVYHEGLDGMIYTIQQMPRVYNDVINAYSNRKDLKVHYYGWVTDRGFHGLQNMQIQFLGFNSSEWYYPGPLSKVPDSELDDYIVNHYDSINSYFSKNFKYWDLIKFIYGYGVKNFGGDRMKIFNLFAPIAFKAFGIPYALHSVYYQHYTNAPRPASGFEDAIFGLPEDLLEPLRKGKYGEVLILRGNGFAIIGSSIEGVKKDIEHGMKNPIKPNAKYIEIRLPLRDYDYWYITGKGPIYLFKMGNKG